ncbi:hypothetical protein SAMN02910400_01585 [Lachnospiraceae bacterium C10]|nr:hypothetical protein SAMN02910400_01585 [Lachnospiraceae bacterium C10]
MKNKKFLILLTTTALIIAGCVLGVYLLNKPEKKSVAKNTTKKTEQPGKNKSRNSDTTDSENTASEDIPTTGHKMTMAEFKKKYPVGSKIKDPDGYTTIVGYDGDDVLMQLPDGTYGYQTGPLEVLDEQQLEECAEEQKKADKAYKEGKYPDNEIGHQRAMDKYREVTKAYIDGKIDKQPKNTDYDNEYSTGINDDTLTVRRTTKGYACIVFEGMVIYESMVMPDGSFEFTDCNVTGTSQALMKWCDDRGIADYYGLSYKQLQKIFGKLDKNSKSMTLKEFYK